MRLLISGVGCESDGQGSLGRWDGGAGLPESFPAVALAGNSPEFAVYGIPGVNPARVWV